jgi:ferric-dicitrate binding protein FerR (iron transport regulator)
MRLNGNEVQCQGTRATNTVQDGWVFTTTYLLPDNRELSVRTSKNKSTRVLGTSISVSRIDGRSRVHVLYEDAYFSRTRGYTRATEKAVREWHEDTLTSLAELYMPRIAAKYGWEFQE